MRNTIGAILLSGLIVCAIAPAHAASDHKALSDAKLIKTVETALASSLRDPESARFRYVRVIKNAVGETTGVCGEIIGKNGFGGYGNYSSFYVGHDNRFIVNGETDIGLAIFYKEECGMPAVY